MTARATRAQKSAAATHKVMRKSAPRGDARFASDPPSMEEPVLRELLQDPILLRLMRSDGIEPPQLTSLLDEARSKLVF